MSIAFKSKKGLFLAVGGVKGQKQLRAAYRHNSSKTKLMTDLVMVCKFKFV